MDSNHPTAVCWNSHFLGTLITKTAKSTIRRFPHPVKVNLRLGLSEPALPYIASDDIRLVNTAFFQVYITMASLRGFEPRYSP